jgi:hypothetical protein
MLPKDLESIDDVSNLPVFPSPEELKYKFIVKCKSKRLIPACFKDHLKGDGDNDCNEGL